jgi:hypothetical protein
MLTECFYCDYEVRLSKSRFWKKLAKSLFKERVLYVLLKGHKHRHITNVRQEIKEEQPSVLKEFKFLNFIPSLSVRHSPVLSLFVNRIEGEFHMFTLLPSLKRTKQCTSFKMSSKTLPSINV